MKNPSKTLFGLVMLCLVTLTLTSALVPDKGYINAGKSLTLLLNTTQKQPFKLTSMENNKEVIRRLFEEALNNRKMGLLAELVSANYTSQNGDKGPEGMEKTFSGLIKAFPDLQWHIKELIAEGDKVFANWEVQGTNTGQYQVFAPTGKSVTGTGMGVFTFKDGKIVQSSVQTDRLGFLQALDILPHDLSRVNSKKVTKDAVVLIDKITVPKDAIPKLMERLNYNTAFLAKQPGLVKNTHYENTDGYGTLTVITVAEWENAEALEKAKKAVQEDYQSQHINLTQKLREWGVTMDRGVYTER
ncbi:putative ester cyclase [Mucilaginibacter frigoritolerans]|uniref:Putative ester cyclase n=1 Tax=Mucilaginibacter frigoritolerans TaxID=652788 RepID=A0A562U9A6_9SPHI|nr:ester cyclase [Mucilaginibacter frigoritolerans]TWJ02384.1 putative ester cyclase [Mucilaginibacter frigoritolerans]